jgi:enamine deaminase RidA (YjgF/YER057c/UK114 family)
MTVQLFSPEGMFQPVPYAHVSVATGSRHVSVSGQIARDAAGNAVAPGDLAGQVAQVLRNTAVGLAGAGATMADVTRLRFLSLDGRPRRSATLWLASPALPKNWDSPSRCRRHR